MRVPSPNPVNQGVKVSILFETADFLAVCVIFGRFCSGRGTSVRWRFWGGLPPFRCSRFAFADWSFIRISFLPFDPMLARCKSPIFSDPLWKVSAGFPRVCSFGLLSPILLACPCLLVLPTVLVICPSCPALATQCLLVLVLFLFFTLCFESVSELFRSGSVGYLNIQ